MKLAIDQVISDFDLDGAGVFFDFEKRQFTLGALRDCYDRYGVVACYFGKDFRSAEDAFIGHYGKHKDIRNVDKFNGVNFALESAIPEELIKVERFLWSERILRYLLSSDQIGVGNSKLIVKDCRFSESVFLHQDSSYQVGLENVTCFFLLSDLRRGALKKSTIRALAGTHVFGHLGDAGEIDRTILASDWPEIEFSYPQFTFVFMNPHLWHYSNPSRLGNSVRGIYAYTCHGLSPISKRKLGFTKALRLNKLNTGKIFLRSRVSRLIDLQRQVDSSTRQAQRPARTTGRGKRSS